MTGNFAEHIGWPAALFSLKCYAAAMLALFVALSIGLERPYWAFLTSYIVAQPLAGAVISKAVFRVIGTFVGAMFAVAIVPPLVNAPELLSLAMALWLALCVFVSLLDRTPRSYMFVLAGYSACLIVFPDVNAPETIFTVATLRVQEITIGILCGSLIHGVVFPGSITNLLLTRVQAMLRDAERWSHDAIAIDPVPGLGAERRRLAQDITELHQMSVHLPFDISRLAPRVRTVRAMQDQLSLLLPLGAAVEDRLATLKAASGGAVPPATAALIAQAREWIMNPGEDRAERTAAADALIARCAAMEPQAQPDMGWADMVRLSLYARLSTLIAAHRDCRDLYDQMETHSRTPVSPRVERRRQRGDAGGGVSGPVRGVRQSAGPAQGLHGRHHRRLAVGRSLCLCHHAAAGRLRHAGCGLCADASVAGHDDGLAALDGHRPADPAGIGQPGAAERPLCQCLRLLRERRGGAVGRHLVRDHHGRAAAIGGRGGCDPPHGARGLGRHRQPRHADAHTARRARLDQPDARSHRLARPPAGGGACR
jgi:hypothetical protein